MKNLTTTLILLVIVAAVGGWIYFNERGPIAQSGSTVLLRTQANRVSSIALQPETGARLEMSRRESGWEVQRVGTNSIAVPADEEMIQELLQSVELLQSGAIVEDVSTPKLKEFGLEKPRGTLIINDAKIEFGDRPSFDSSKIYARVTSESTPQVALLPARLSEFVMLPFSEWRDKATLRVKAEDAEKLTISAPLLKANFERIFKGEDGEPDQWMMLSPVDGRADSGTISALLESLSLTQTPQFLEDDPQDLAKWELEKPVAQVSVTTSGGVSTLRLGKVVPGGRAAQNSVSRVIFVVPDSLLTIISRPLRDWRDRQILRFSTEAVQTLKVSARGQSAQFSKNGETWTRANGNGKSATATAQAALDIQLGLQRLTAEDFIDKPQALSTYGLEEPALEAELTSSEWAAPRRIRLGVKNGNVYAQAHEGGAAGRDGFKDTIYVLSPNSLKTFKLALDVLFPAKSSN